MSVTTARSRTNPQMWLWLAFFCSGIAGISYELTWVRYLTQMFGASTPAISATVSIFFIGMALGAGWAGKRFDHMKHPLRAYAWLECSIGVMALLVPWLFWLCEHFLLQQHGPQQHSTLLLLLLATVILLPPTTMLGAIFPAMAAVVRHSPNATQATGSFYGYHTLGSVLGCLLVSFWWLPSLGNLGTSFCMAALNIGIALLILGSYKRFQAMLPQQAPAHARPNGSKTASGTPTPETTTHTSSKMPMRWAWLLASGSGFFAIGIEVLWTRALALSFPANVYIFTLVLAAYLVGIGLGALWISRRSRTKAPSARLLLWLYMTIAAGGWLALYLFPRLAPWGLALFEQGWLTGWYSYLFWLGLATVCAMLPATLAMGAALPLLIGLNITHPSQAGRVSGRLYAANTVGGVLGSFVVTFGLMPPLGLSISLLLFSLGYLALAMLLPQKKLPRFGRLVPAGLLAVGLLLTWQGLYPEADPERHRHDQRLLYYRDTPSATIALYQDQNGIRTLRANNDHRLRSTARQTVAMQYQLGHLALLMHRAPKSALLLDFSTGTTLAAMAEHQLKHLHSVGPSDPLLGLFQRHFRQVNQRVWKRPHVQVFSDDAQRFLQRQPQRYDVILTSLSSPSSANFSTQHNLEFYHHAAARLQSQGIFITWLPLSQLSVRDTATILQTFLHVFPHSEGWIGQWDPEQPILGLIGRLKVPAPAPRQKFEQRLQALVHRSYCKMLRDTPKNQASCKANTPLWDAKHALAFPTARRLLGTRQLRQWAGDAPIHRQQKPVLDFTTPRSLFRAHTNQKLWLSNLREIKRLRSLRGTPWYYLEGKGRPQPKRRSDLLSPSKLTKIRASTSSDSSFTRLHPHAD